jgi:hypothetical protein
MPPILAAFALVTSTEHSARTPIEAAELSRHIGISLRLQRSKLCALLFTRV